MKKELEKCTKFLLTNGWEFCETIEEYSCHNKDGCISVDLSENDMVFIDDTGDFLHAKTDYYTLLGVLIHHRQIPINFKQYSDYTVKIVHRVKK